MIVIDAGAFLEVLLASGAGEAVTARLRDAHGLAPSLLDAEVLHRLITLEKHGVLTGEEIDTGIDDLRDAPIERVEHRALLMAARRFAVATSGYDSLYLALAAQLEAPLITTDVRLSRTAAHQFGLDVDVVRTSVR